MMNKKLCDTPGPALLINIHLSSNIQNKNNIKNDDDERTSPLLTTPTTKTPFMATERGKAAGQTRTPAVKNCPSMGSIRGGMAQGFD